jgi:hypothetical protein
VSRSRKLLAQIGNAIRTESAKAFMVMWEHSRGVIVVMRIPHSVFFLGHLFWLLANHQLTTPSSRRGFATRLMSDVRPHSSYLFFKVIQSPK